MRPGLHCADIPWGKAHLQPVRVPSGTCWDPVLGQLRALPGQQETFQSLPPTVPLFPALSSCPCQGCLSFPLHSLTVKAGPQPPQPEEECPQPSASYLMQRDGILAMTCFPLRRTKLDSLRREVFFGTGKGRCGS